jgi:small subunit ribosomal protein S2
MLTNWKTVSQSIKTLKKIEERLADTEVGYNKKEKLVLERERNKLEQALGGIKNMGGYPDLVFIIDTNKESLAIAEAKKLKLPIMAILDTNCNPDGITFPIPGNDDSAKSIKLFCRLISDAALAGVKENMAIAGIDISKIEGEEEVAKVAEFKNAAAEKAEKKSEAKTDRKPADRDNRKKEIVRKSEKKSDEKSDKKSDEKKSAKPEVKVVTKKAAPKKPAAAKTEKKS